MISPDSRAWAWVGATGTWRIFDIVRQNMGSETVPPSLIVDR
jgi:hypothetical protein